MERDARLTSNRSRAALSIPTIRPRSSMSLAMTGPVQLRPSCSWSRPTSSRSKPRTLSALRRVRREAST